MVNKKEKQENKKAAEIENDYSAFILTAGILLICLLVISPVLGCVVAVASTAVFFSVKTIKNALTKSKEEKYRLISNKVLLSGITIPENMPLPYAIINNGKKILVYNQGFRDIFRDREIGDVPITDFFSDYKLYINKQTVTFNDRYFEVYTEKCRVSDNSKASGSKDVYAVTLVEVTENRKLLRIIEDIRTVAGLIYIDNYEEVIESIDESRVPILTALIEKRLNDFAAKTGGIIKKFEKDRFVFMLSRKSLEELKEKKFEILNEIKELRSGEHIPVTLSIGIGISDDSLDDAMKNARTAIDLALGRGGDQVLIKEGEKYLFYGGKSGEISHNARIRARVKADALKELMADSSNIYVMGHKNGDLDSLGSSIGIYAIARDVGKDCQIVIDNVSVGIKRLYQRIQEKNNYDEMFVSGAEALEKITDKTLVVIMDTHRQSMVENVQVLEKAKKVVVFDHHRKSTDFIENAVLIYHEPYASSTAELVTEMIQYIGVKLKNLEADALLSGITVDTKNFAVKTGAITFEAAAFLRRNGADSVRVRLLFQNDLDAYKAKAVAVKDAEIYHDSIAISVCPSNVENSMLTAAQAADDLLNITGIKASVVLCEQGDIVHLSARSFGDINVQVIMEKLGGGGHLGVAGAQLRDTNIESARLLLKEKIDEYLQEEI
ncbi:hypothetical protein B5E58_06990 [Tyzzerella sp. An114]|uniref:DHH family phosphoesterase n=1 Tax=Tyzzerella sp. An114 TaxID=1965545 RepID=UPI000B44AE4D|nr:DHH family phosphoesterase [Tyzzerella sp. An114]OUQ58363.1 hypothetical protein B5E58_06990 [Tyzzerella sp. An114]HIT72573.1 DHH family phosphoesterase [Candidatus Fimicola cottocaccae]